MRITALEIPDVKLIAPEFIYDHRGYFAETYNRETLRISGVHAAFDRDHISFSASPGTVRGLHFQTPPHALAKLVRVQQGRIFDVALDIRHGSPHFGQHVAIEIDAASGNQVYVPPGFAHGFCTIEPNTIVAYKVSGSYQPEFDVGVAWNDPALSIAWPVSTHDAVMSERDQTMPRLADLPGYFDFETLG